jgi:3-oxoacyl-[acyl-carrier-protein] synthase-3
MDKTFNTSVIRGVASAVPENIISIDTMASPFSSAHRKRLSMQTGIKTLRTALPSQKTSDFCLAAAQQCLADCAVKSCDIDAIVLVTQTPDQRLPSTSCVLQHQLGLRKDVLAFDIHYGCSGYLYGLLQANILIQAECAERILVLTGDVLTHYLGAKGSKSRLMFGDAGNATLIEKGKSTAAFHMMTDGAGASALQMDFRSYGLEQVNDPGLMMQGKAVMDFVLEQVPQSIRHTMQTMGWQKQDVDFLLLHQANKMIVEGIQHAGGFAADKVPLAMDGYGNTGPASIPLTMNVYRDVIQQQSRKQVILSGFGVGLSWGSVALDLTGCVLSPIVEIN